MSSVLMVVSVDLVVTEQHAQGQHITLIIKKMFEKETYKI